MTIPEAREALEKLPEEDFQTFFKQLPQRTQQLVRGGMCKWQEVLPPWYIKYVEVLDAAIEAPVKV